MLLDAAVHSSHQNQHKQVPLITGRAARSPDAAPLLPATGGARIATDSAAWVTPVMRPKQQEEGVVQAAAADECPAVGEASISISPRSGPRAGADADSETSPAGAAAGADGSKLVSGGNTGKVGGGARNEEVDVKAQSFAGAFDSGAQGGAGAAKSPVEVYVDQCAWRVLHAASRTASGGDSFFVVQVSCHTISNHILRSIILLRTSYHIVPILRMS